MRRFNIQDAKFLKEIKHPRQRPRPPRPTVAFAGRSNAGKSSVINSLTRRRGLARTSSSPGRTQSIVYFDVSDRYYFVDLPGYGYAKAPLKVKAQWGPMISAFLNETGDLRLVVVILDIRRDPNPADLQLIETLEVCGVPYIFVLTKRDKLTKTRIEGRIRAIGKALGHADGDALVPYSSVDGSGREELIKVIEEVLARVPRRAEGPEINEAARAASPELPDPADDEGGSKP